MTDQAPARRQGGRPLDRSRDGTILDATLEVLADVGYEAMTVDAVAARAGTVRATVYRRWASKADLVVAAVGRMSSADSEKASLPDTGTLRGDLVAAVLPFSAEEMHFRIDVMAAVNDAGRTEPKIAALSVDAGIEPWVETSRILLQRALDRGEYPAASIDTLARVLPTFSLYRTAVERRPITRDFVIAIIDDVILPAMRGDHQHNDPERRS